MDNEEPSADPSVRACGELFELLKEICGGSEESAAEVWERAFWFKFDGRNPIVIPDIQVAEFAGWVVGATMLMKALTASGIIKK